MTTPLHITNEEEIAQLHPDSFLFVNLKNKIKDALKLVFQKILSLLDIAVKVFDIMDDLWTAFSRINESLMAFTPIVTGVFSFIANSFFAVTATLKIRKAWENLEKLNRIGKITTNSIILGIALAGVGLSVAYFVSKFVIVAGAPLMPAILSSLMTTIFILQYNQLTKDKYTIRTRLCEVNKRILEINDELEKINTKIKNLSEALAYPDSVDQYTANKTNLSKIEKLKLRQQTLIEEKTNLVEQHNEYEKKIRSLNRRMFFKGIEIFASVLVTLGVVFGTSSLIAGSVVSFGAAPLTILFLGVALGIGLKIFEHVDAKNDHRYSNWIKKNIFGKEPYVEMAPPAKPSIEPKIRNTIDVMRALNTKSTIAIPDQAAHPAANVIPIKQKRFHNHPESFFSNQYNPLYEKSEKSHTFRNCGYGHK